MTKSESIAWFKEINAGAGVDRRKRLDVIPRGNIAIREWDSGLFTLGLEYGAMIAIAEIFDLKEKDFE